MPTWEKLLLGVLAILVLLFFFPGVRHMVEQSQQAEKDWPAVLIPLALVVLFVIGLMAIV